MTVALILAFDTATAHLAVVLGNQAKPLAWREDTTPALSHAEKLNVFIAEVLAQAGYALSDLDAVAVGVGPGSYTGLRIGLSAAKGLCFALDKPLIGMGTLDVLVAQARCRHTSIAAGSTLFPMVDARRMEVYTCAFEREGQPLGKTAPLILEDAWCTAQAQAGPVVVFGDGADKASDLWKAHPEIVYLQGIRPGTEGLAACADQWFREGRFSNLAYLVPEYGKPANVAQKRSKE